MLSWLRSRNDVHHLIAKGKYAKAIKILKEQVREEPDSLYRRKLLADVLARAGDREYAADVLFGLADELAREGFIAKAVAILKRIQRIDRRQSDVVERLTRQLVNLYGQEGASASLVDPEPGASETAVPFTTSEVVLPEVWQAAAAKSRGDFHWSPLFASLSKEDLSVLIGALRLLVKEPGAIIVTEGEPGDSLFILANGTARVYRRNEAGRNSQAGIVGDGEIFGKASVLAGQARDATVTAATRCELLELDRATFETLAEDHPRIRSLIEEASENLEVRDAPPDEEL